MEFDPFEGMEACAWCDEFALVGNYQAIGGGADPVPICGMCIQKHGHMYKPYVTA